MIDAGFIVRKLEAKNNRYPTIDDLREEINIIQKHPSFEDLTLLRIYYYDAPPLHKTIKNPISGELINLQKSDRYKSNLKLHNHIKSEPYFALRLGELAERGWKIKNTKQHIQDPSRTLEASDLAPNIQQKGVDLRIGLDIARMSLTRTIDKIILCTGDSDMIPCFKFARREGVQMYLHSMGHNVKPELKSHADVILS